MKHLKDLEEYNREKNTYRGKWLMCDEDTYVGQYDIMIEEEMGHVGDDTALNGIKMKCFHNNGTLAKYFIFIAFYMINQEYSVQMFYEFYGFI